MPSILYGLLGLFVFVRGLALGRSLIAGALTLALLVLPIIVVTTGEALRAVPYELREAGLALGASRLSVALRVVVPAAARGIVTGVLLAVSRAIGETAPLIVVGALTFVTFLPTDPGAPFAALPMQVFAWASRPTSAFAPHAAAGIVLLLALVGALELAALAVRTRAERQMARRQ